MLGGYFPNTGQIGNRAGKLANLVVGAGTETEFLHRLLEDEFARLIEFAELLHLSMAHPGVGVNLPVTETLGPDACSLENILSHRSRVELAGFRAQLAEAYRRHVNVDVNSVHQRPRDLLEISTDLARRAFASSRLAAEIATGARIHRRDEHELGGKPHRSFGTRDNHKTVFQRLANHLENLPRKFGEFVKEQYPEMSQR